ncbi:MAG: tetratricopeptide (TPR) repeat protein, partial [Sediminicola sp.]
HTTIEDFTKFAQASLYTSKNNKKHQQILSATTLEQMMKPALASNGSYGLGYQVDAIQDTSVVLRGHGGANTGWHAFLMLDPETNDGFIMITNGGAGHNIYRQAFCDWIFWKTGESQARRCNILPSVANKLKQIVDNTGVDKIEVAYADLKKNQADTYNFSEDQLNQLGYHYLGNEKVENALAIFKLNAETFPNSANVYDSYGEALLANGDKEKAIENYLKSVKIDPGNDYGIKVLGELGVNTENLAKPIVIDEKVLERYIGKYALSPEFIITVTKVGSKMMAQATGQGEFEIYPKSDTVFYLKVVEAQVTFNLNEEDQVISMTLLQGGQESTGLKVD